MSGDTTCEGDDSVGDETAERCRFAFLWVFPKLQGRVLEVGQGPWRLGRGAECQIFVDDRRASREHAEIAFDGPVVLLRDLQSTNGTFVDGAQIEQVPVKTGSVVRIGSQVGVFCQAPPGATPSEWFRELVPGFHAGPALQRALEPAVRAAVSDLPVMIVGDTGTGKERVADFLHRASGRPGPFHAINCAAIPAEVAESQLFGHKQGAFTGAQHANAGHFRAAHRGTLFLDEIAELPLVVQSKLLRVLQERAVIPVGDTKAVPVDVRIVTSSQKPLAELVQAQRFRADLRARLSGLTIELPPLSARVEEVPLLFTSFLAQYSRGAPPRVEGKLVERLCLHAWPGNVRELELLARELLVSHGRGGTLRRAHLPKHMFDSSAPDVATTARHDELVRLARALHESRGNVTHASARLGISRARAYRLIDGQSISKLLGKYLRSDSL